MQKQTLLFANGNKAAAVFPPAGSKPQEIVEALSLVTPKALIVAIGGADDFEPTILPRLTQLYRSGVARAAINAGAMIIDGGTGAGVMSLVGEGVAACGNQTTLLGVAPGGKIKLPDSEGKGTPLEPNHTHFVITEGTEWGAETPTLFELVRWFTKGAGKAVEQNANTTGHYLPVVAVLSGGGAVSKQEVLRVVRQNIPLIIVEGTGGFSDEVATACKGAKDTPIDDADMAEIVSDGELHFHQLGNSVKGIERLIVRELGTDKVLTQAWETFADYDMNANLQQKKFNNLQLTIILLGVLVTALVVLQQVFAPRDAEHNLSHGQFVWGKPLVWWTVYYLLILLPILLTVLITASNRFKQGSKWLLLRAGAEAIKREIYSYRVRGISDRIEAEQLLAKRVEDITRSTMRTEVNLSALKPYDKSKGFPPYMYATNGGDDGFSLLSPERYVEVRLGDQLRYYSKKAVVLEKQLRVLYWATFLVGGLGAFLAAVGQQVWIALTTSVVASLGTYLGYRQIENSLTKYNQTATDLLNIRGWWNALSAEEQANNDNIVLLVQHTEKVLQTELDGWIQQMQNALAELRKNQETAASQKPNAQQPGGSAAEDHETGPDPTVSNQKTEPAATGKVKVVVNTKEKSEEELPEPNEEADGEGDGEAEPETEEIPKTLLQ